MLFERRCQSKGRFFLSRKIATLFRCDRRRRNQEHITCLYSIGSFIWVGRFSFLFQTVLLSPIWGQKEDDEENLFVFIRLRFETQNVL